MTGNQELEQDALDFRPGSDVVHHERSDPVPRETINDDPDMGEIAGQHPGHKVPGAIFAWVLRSRQNAAVPLEEGLEVWDAAMVYVRIGPGKSPVVRVFVEVIRHVSVDEALEINSQRSIRPHDDIGAHANVAGHVPVPIGNLAVASVVGDAMGCPFDGRLHQLRGGAVRGRLRLTDGRA